MNNMNVAISGIGCLCSLGNTPEQVWEALNSQDFITKYDTTYEFKTTIPSKIKRKADRFSLIGMYTVGEAKKYVEEIISNEKQERVGTIFSSVYGPLSTNLAFTREYLNYEPEECSPLKFANTVANACLGHICMYYKFKGVSTMLMGSNCIAYSLDLFKQQKADYIFAGYIEEYNEDIFNALKQVQGLGKKKFTENAVTFLLTDKDKMQQNKYCSILAIKEVNLKRNPLVSPNCNNQDDSILIKRCISGCLENINVTDIDCAITTSHENLIDEEEVKIVKERLPNVPIANRIKGIAGEVLGSSLNINLLIASLCMKYGYVPKSISGNTNDIQVDNMVLVTGYDIAGNYTCILLKK